MLPLVQGRQEQVHSARRLGVWMQWLGVGAAPFGHVTPHEATSAQRRRLGVLKIASAGEYRLHDFRCGHSKGLVERRVLLREILLAGEWRSRKQLSTRTSRNQMASDRM